VTNLALTGWGVTLGDEHLGEGLKVIEQVDTIGEGMRKVGPKRMGT
jgi:hypothetical protein